MSAISNDTEYGFDCLEFNGYNLIQRFSCHKRLMELFLASWLEKDARTVTAAELMHIT